MSAEGSGGSGEGTEKEKEEEEKIEGEKVLRKRPWTQEEDAKLSQMVELHGSKNWTLISSKIPGRSDPSCRLRLRRQLIGEGSRSAQGTEKEKEEEDIALRRRPWTPEEDAKLSQMVRDHGSRNWLVISSEIPGRSNRSCRDRWCNQLSPSVDRRPFTAEEDNVIVRAHLEHGNKWAKIIQSLPGRTGEAVKNRWHSNLQWRKRHAEGSQQQQEMIVGTSASSSSNSEFDVLERKRLCQRGEEDVETPGTATINLLEPEPEPITSLSLRLPGSGGDSEGSARSDEEKKNEN